MSQPRPFRGQDVVPRSPQELCELGQSPTLATQGRDGSQDNSACPCLLTSLDAHCVAGINVSKEMSISSDPIHAEAEEKFRCKRKIVLRETNTFRRIWECIMFFALGHIATLFLYRLAFIEMHVPEPLGQNDHAWAVFEHILYALFLFDVVMNFLCTYRDTRGNEVDKLARIARHYVKGFFVLDLIACIPPEVIDLVIQSLSSYSQQFASNANRAVKVTRLQRMSRLARLVRLVRLAKIASFAGRWKLWHLSQRLRGVRVVNFLVGLLWVVHVLACGWYLCAALHENFEETWLGYREVSGDRVLLNQGPFEQWFHSMYFVLTVFTTVGFGDMSATTMGEIAYVCVTMVIGVVVNSIIISEVIRVVTRVDETNLFVGKQKDLVNAFADHTELDRPSRNELVDWISSRAQDWASHDYDRKEMQELIANKHIPRELTEQLAIGFFGGGLAKNNMLTVCDGLYDMPPRLPLLFALAVHRTPFEAGDMVYHTGDMAMTVYLVLEGTFSYIARPGCNSVQQETVRSPTRSSVTMRTDKRKLTNITNLTTQTSGLMQFYPYCLFSSSNYFGDSELVDGCARKTHARCEVGGSVLVLGKQDFWWMVDQFPQFGTAWRRASRHREAHRIRRLACQPSRAKYRKLAAIQLQRYFRARLDTLGSGTGKSHLGTSSQRLCSLASAASKQASTESDDGAIAPFRESDSQNMSIVAQSSEGTGNSLFAKREVGSEQQAHEIASLRGALDALHVKVDTLLKMSHANMEHSVSI